LFRFLFLLQAFVLLVNPKLLLHLDSNLGNILQKLLIILTGAALMATRPVHKGVVVLIAAMVVLTFLCAIGSQFPQFEWRLYIGGLVSIVAPFILLTAAPREQDRDLGIIVFASLPLLMTAVGVIYQLAGISPLFNSDPSSGTRLAGTQGIAAYLAAAGFTGTFAALELAERKHLGYALLFVADVIILLLAGGRMALGAAVLVCGIDYLRSFKRVPLLKFFAPVWILVVGGILLMTFAEDNLRHLQSTSLSNRDLIWAPLIRQLDAHPWFGVGLGNQQLLVHVVGVITTFASHNEYLRLAVELGYPGAIVFFALTLGIILLVWNSAWVGRDPMFLVCAAGFYIYGITDNTFSVPQAYFILTAASFAGRPKKMRSPALAVDAARPHRPSAPTAIEPSIDLKRPS
jgi:O-antigen ligase